MTENPDTAVSTFKSICPFCGGEFFDACDPVTKEPLGIIHSLPMCDSFKQLEPHEYVKAVNDFHASDILRNPKSKRGKS